MAESKFTPEPWFIGGECLGYSVYTSEDWQTFGTLVAQAAPTKRNEERRANAHLIAAAPELYEALHKLRNELSGWLGAYESELRKIMGNTNYNILAMRRDEAMAALLKATPEQSDV